MVLSYGVDRLDWLARMLAVVGVVVVAGLLLGGRRWGSRLGGARDQAFEQ